MKRPLVIPGPSIDSELHHLSLCSNDMASFMRSGQVIKIFSLVLHLWFHCGEILLGLLVCDYVYGNIRDQASSQVSIVSIDTRLWAGHTRNCSVITSRDKRCFSSVEWPDWLNLY